jgi:hypothetical protein
VVMVVGAAIIIVAVYTIYSNTWSDC